MNGKNIIEKTSTYLNNEVVEADFQYENWSDKIRILFFQEMWEQCCKEREECRIYLDSFNEYGVSFENSIYLYKIIPEKTVFGYYKAYKKELDKNEYIKLVKKLESEFQFECKNKYEKPSKKLKTKKIRRNKSLQLYLFDLEPYTILLEKKNYIEDKAKQQLKNVAQKIWSWKQKIEKEDERKFIKSFNFASFTPNEISPYIVFDERGKLKKGCKKYWNYLKKEVSKLSNIPLNHIIM